MYGNSPANDTYRMYTVYTYKCMVLANPTYVNDLLLPFVVITLLANNSLSIPIARPQFAFARALSRLYEMQSQVSAGTPGEGCAVFLELPSAMQGCTRCSPTQVQTRCEREGCTVLIRWSSLKRAIVMDAIIAYCEYVVLFWWSCALYYGVLGLRLTWFGLG